MSLNQNLFKLMNKKSITWYSSGSVNVYNIPCLGCGSQLKEKLSNDGWEILVSATSLVTHVALCLRNGEIRMNTLRIVHKNRDRFLELYSLLSKEDSAVTGEISEDKGNQQEARSMEVFLEMRIEELKAFEKEREAVSTFITTFSTIKIGESWCIISLSKSN